MSFKIQIPQSRNFFGITVKLVRGFKEKRKISQIFIIYNFPERINSDVALAYFLMSVLVVADRIHTVIEMNCLESFKPDYTVKFFKNSVKIIHNVITASKTWQVSRHTPILSFRSTRSIIIRSSSKVLPTSVPLPAIVSSNTVVVISSNIAVFNAVPICSTAALTPCPV